MKKILTLITAITFVSLSIAAPLAKDHCKAYFPIEKGTKLTYENYSKKDKLESTDVMEVMDILETAEGLLIKIHASSVDKKGKETYDSDFEYRCEGNKFYVSLESMMDGEMMAPYKDMEVEIEQTDLVIPSALEVGATLPDGSITMNVKSNGIQIMSMKIEITDRKVEAIEEMTTDAGTFTCFKMSQNSTMNMGFTNKTYKSVDWIAENVGSVRSESYNDSGELQSYRVLKSIEK